MCRISREPHPAESSGGGRSGQLSKITDAKGNITTYAYNWLGERK
ncbi:hypothetical protein ABZ079_29545 [Streptomyces sp. NPDC006314]